MPGTFGYSDLTGAASDYESTGKVRTSLYVLSEDAYVYKISSYNVGANFGAWQTPAKVRATIYENSGGAVGAFNSVTDEVWLYGDRPAGWVDFLFPTEVFLDGSPTGYWLGRWAGGQTLVSRWYRHPNGAAGCYTQASTYNTTGDPVDPFGTPDGLVPTSGDLLIYASYVTTTDPPLNYQDPVVYGANVAGIVVTVDKGLWAGNVTGYSYQWKSDGTNVGTDSDTYTVADSGHSITCDVTATNANGSTSETTVALPAGFANWNPLLQQYEAPDTIWLYDPDVEETISYAAGGIIDSGGGYKGFNQPGSIADSDPWRVGNPYALEPGKFRTGSRGSAAAEYMWMPGTMLPTDRFTVEGWFRCDNDWADFADSYALLTFGGFDANFGGTSSFRFGFDLDGHPTCTFQHRHNVAYVNSVLTSGVLPLADEWVNLAASYDGTTLSFWVNAVFVNSAAVAPPQWWGASDRQIGGVVMLYGRGGGGTLDEFTFSDLRISRLPRDVAVPRIVTATNTITITDTPAGDTINQDLRAGLHYYSPDSATVGDPTIEGLNDGYAAMSRTDKFLSAIRIKAGAPDATHPTLGHSGSYSYHWGPVDNTLDYLARLNLAAYIGLDSTPNILGGGNAPFSVADCDDPTKLVGFGNFNTEVPSDFDAYGMIAADFYYYVTVTRGDTVAFWTWWNEPSTGGGFWDGTLTELNTLFLAVYDAIKAVDPDARIGGNDGMTFERTGSEAADYADLFAYYAAESLDVANISMHTYSGDVGKVAWFGSGIQEMAATAGIDRPDLIVGEWNWNDANFHAIMMPWNPYNFGINAWAASFYMSMLIQLQAHGYVASVFTHLAIAETTDTSYNANGLTSSTQPWVGRNVFEIWRNMAAGTILTLSDADLENGVSILASSGVGGAVSVLVVNHKYRLDRVTDLEVTLPASVTSDMTATYYLIDEDHSDFYDQGSGDGTLETVTAPTVTDGTIMLALQPRSVSLIQFSSESPSGSGAIEMKKIGTGAWQAVAADVVVAGAVERQWIPGHGWRTVAADQDQGTGAVERQKRPSAPWLNVPADEGV